VFGEVYMPPPRLFVHGAVDTAEALCHAAKHLGWTTIPQICCGFLAANAIAGNPTSRRKAASGRRGILALTAQP